MRRLLLAWIGASFLLAAHASAQQTYTIPETCIATSAASTLPDARRRAELAECLLKSRSYVEAVKRLEAAGYVVNSTISKQIEFAESSGQRERAGKMLERIILPP